MGGIQIGVQQADGDGLDTGRLQLAYALTDLVLVQGNQNVAVRCGDALLDGEPVTALDQRLCLPGQILLKGEVMRLLVPGDVQDVPETLGGDHPDLRTGVRQRGIRGDRGAVHQLVDLRKRDPGLFAELYDAVDHGLRRVVRGGGNLFHNGDALVVVREIQVGECTADVYSDALHKGVLSKVWFRTGLKGKTGGLSAGPEFTRDWS